MRTSIPSPWRRRFLLSQNSFKWRNRTLVAQWPAGLFITAVLFTTPWPVQAQDARSVDPSHLPPAAQQKVDYVKDIKPIIDKSCSRCHGAEKPKGGLDLTTRESALKGGRRGAAILPGQSAKSPLIHYVAGVAGGLHMPPAKSEALAPDQIGLLRAWIDQGVPWTPGDTGAPQFSISDSWGVRWIGVSGDRRQFREHYWTREGWSGGIENFEILEKQPGKKTVAVEGRVLPMDDDYKATVRYERNNLGYARVGWEQYRKYYDDSGGYYQALNFAPFYLDHDLYTTIGKAWVEAGLNKPDWPRISLGYEHQYKQGNKSLTSWGYAGSQPPDYFSADGRKIYPAWKDVDEEAHLIKLNAAHDFPILSVENNLRLEFYEQDNRRNSFSYYSTTTGNLERFGYAREQYNHFQAANTLRLEKQANDWLFLGAGYLYVNLDGDSVFGNATMLTPVAVAGYAFDDKFWVSRQILLEQQTHTFNFNSRLGPWQGLSLSAGVQSEWMSQHGLGDVNLDEGDPTNPAFFIEQPALLRSDLSRFTLDENFGLRYTQIPFTVIYGEARLQQETMGQYEEMQEGTGNSYRLGRDFLQDSTIKGSLEDYRAGFTFSPWIRLSLNAFVKHRDKQTDYDHPLDLTRSATDVSALDGYPAFIRARGIITDEATAKLALRLANWWKATLTYQIAATDYETKTDAVAGDISPGGRLNSANYDANVYSLNHTITPWRRLYLSGTFSYRDGRMKSAWSGTNGIAPYEGDVYSVIASVTYILTEKTDLNASYTLSRADYRQNSVQANLPLGIEYDWHSLVTGVNQRISKNVTAKLQYGYYLYDEPSSGSYNNYAAHAIFASVSIRWP